MLRMNWSKDERLYQPRIHSERIRDLHVVCKQEGEFMTVMVDQAIKEFCNDRLRRLQDDQQLHRLE